MQTRHIHSGRRPIWAAYRQDTKRLVYAKPLALGTMDDGSMVLVEGQAKYVGGHTHNTWHDSDVKMRYWNGLHFRMTPHTHPKHQHGAIKN